ncbi:MAG: glycosyltransferase family 2 protein [Candidatus Aminicenantes bacterium]|nr:glycosyltransferase family 2 protein [Candidatus Aminicenantes bacterium]
MRIKSNIDKKLRPEVSILTLNWNVDKMLEKCINSVIKNINGISYEMVIIDNNSMGQGFMRVKQNFSQYKNFTWIENDQNLGLVAFNHVLKYCKGRYLLLLAPDVIIFPETIERMIHFLDNNTEAGAVTAKLLNPDGSPQNYYYKFWTISMCLLSTGAGKLFDKIIFNKRLSNHFFDKNVDSDNLTCVDQPAIACFLLRWDSVSSEYLIDEDFPFYFEDVDLCKRIYENGYKIFVLPQAEVCHFYSASFDKTDDGWRDEEFRRSAIKYFKKYHTWKVPVLKMIFLLEDMIRIFFSAILGKWRSKKKKNG